jgi:hypothetical protein
MSLSRGCPDGRKFSTVFAAEKAAGRGREGVPAECARCGYWHLRVPEVRLGFSAEVKLLARTRAGHGDPSRACCEACGIQVGRTGGDIQHRLARGAGGCKDEVVNSLANAAVLCRPCHGKAEARNPHMGPDGAGWWIRGGKGPAHDPRFVGVLLYSEGASGVPRWLSADEPRYLDCPPDAARAA